MQLGTPSLIGFGEAFESQCKNSFPIIISTVLEDLTILDNSIFFLMPFFFWRENSLFAISKNIKHDEVQIK